MIELGRNVKDKITGFIGVSTSYVESYGIRQVAIQPRSKEGNDLPDVYTFDENGLEYVDDVVVVPPTTPVSHDFKIGDRVVSKTVGEETGVIQLITTFLNGCVRLTVALDKPIHNKTSLADNAIYWEHDKKNTNLFSNDPKQPKKGGPIMKAERY